MYIQGDVVPFKGKVFLGSTLYLGVKYWLESHQWGTSPPGISHRQKALYVGNKTHFQAHQGKKSFHEFLDVMVYN